MANGKIIIDVELNDDGVLSGLKNIESMAGGAQGKKNGGLIGNMFGGIKNIVGAGLALKGVQVAWNGLKSGVSDGVSRYDTMQRFPKMMQQIGFTSGEADQAIQNLSTGIQGLPTALDSVTGTAQQIALMTGDLTGAVDTTLALNNAFLASGSSSGDASRGLVQFQQMMARGEPDLQSWRTLMETMPVALQMLGKELGYSGENLYELYDAMQAGELTFQDFTNGLIDLNEKQGGLAEMALENSVGIATSWQNIKTAVGRGWADLINATDRGLESIGAGTIAEQMNKIKGVVDTGFGAVTGTVSGFFGIMSQFQDAMGDGFSNMSDGISLGVRGATQSIKMTTEEITALATNWNNMTLEEKQAQVQTMGKEDVGELLQLLGVDFDSLPSEYHKDAYANAYGYDALEELLFLTGEWHDLTLEEKRAVLEAQIENEQIEEVIEQRDLWNDEEFIRQLAEINMNDNGALEQVVELINEWGVLEGLPPIDLKVDVRQIHPAIQAIADLIKVGQAVARDFFRPMTEGFQEIGRALGNFRSGFSEAVRHFNNGDWERSWSRLKNSTIQVFDEVGNAVSDMWTGMQKNIQAIDWRLTFQNISGSVQDVVSSINNWLTTAVPKVYDFIVDVFIDPNSQLNQGARDFHAQVMGLLDSAWDWAVDKVVNVLLNPEAEINDGVFHDAVMGEIDKAWAEIKSSVGEAYRELEVKIQLTWNELAGKVAEWVSGVKASILSGWAEIQGYSEALGAEGIQQEVVMDMIILEGEGWSPSEIQAYIDEKHGEGEYETHVHLVPQLEAGEPEPSVQDAVESVVGNETLTVEQEVEAKINIYAGQGFDPGRIQELIDKEFGAGTYESVVTAEILIEILEKLQYSEGRIQQLIDAEFGEGTYETIVNVQVETEEEVMESHTLEPELQGVIKGQVIEPIEKDVVVNPNIVVGHSAGGGGLAEEGAQPGSLAGGGMFARLIEQVNQGMVQVQEAVTQSMTQVNESISLSVQTWGETLTLGFSTLTLGVTAGMLSMTMAVALGFTGMTLAVTTGMIAMSLAVTTGMLAMTLAISTGMLGMTLAVTLGMTAMSLAVSTAMVAMSLAITLAMVAIELSVTTSMTEMSTATSEAMNEMSTATTEAMTEVSTATTESMTEMSTATNEAMTEMSTSTTEAMTEMSTATTEAMSEMSTAIDELAQTASDASSQIAESFSQVAQSISDSMQSAVQAVEDAGNQIISTLDALGGQAQASGARIGVGLANGIYSSAGSAIAAAQYLADSVNNILNSVFRFGSPSKVTTQYGEWIGQGLSRGMEHTYGLVNRVSNKLGGYALPTIDPNRAIGLSGYGSSGSTNYQSEVNIHIDKFINNRKEDLPQLVEELRYYENVKLQGGL